MFRMMVKLFILAALLVVLWQVAPQPVKEKAARAFHEAARKVVQYFQ